MNLRPGFFMINGDESDLSVIMAYSMSYGDWIQEKGSSV